MKKGISIIICCYNSESRLPKTLEYLAKQEINKDIPIEVIVVDNASTDRTKEIAKLEWGKYRTDFLFKVIEEKTPGKNFACKKGLKESQYAYFLFCDDDNWLQSDYLQRAFDLMELNPQIGALGGQGIAVSDIDIPDWFFDFAYFFAVGKQAKVSGNISKRGFIWGAGTMSRRDLVQKAFDDKYPLLTQGRTGNQLISGEDPEFCRRILFLGYTLYYDEALVYYHYMSPNRLTWAYKKRLSEGIDASRNMTGKYDVILNEMKKNFFKRIVGIVFNILKLMKSGSSTVDTRNEIWAKTGYLFKNEKIIKDPEYKTIVRFALQK